MRGWRPAYRHVFVVLAVVACIYFAVRTSSAVLIDQGLAKQLKRDQGLVNTLEAQNVALRAELAYEQTPAYTEQVAREQLGLMKPGDHVVHVLVAPLPQAAPAPATPTPKPSAPTRRTAPTWRGWWLLFTRPEPGAP